MPDARDIPAPFDPDSDPQAWLDSYRQSLDGIGQGVYPAGSSPGNQVSGLLGDLDTIRQAVSAGGPVPAPPGSFQVALADQATSTSPEDSAPPTSNLSSDGADFIKRQEGWHGLGQHSVEGGADTIFWGHKLQPGEDPQTMDPDETFEADKARAEGKVRNALGGGTIPQNQFDGLVSFAYNDPAAFSATPDNFFHELVSGGNIRGAANRMLLWNKAADAGDAKTIVPGLTNRRNAERNLILDGDYDAP